MTKTLQTHLLYFQLLREPRRSPSGCPVYVTVSPEYRLKVRPLPPVLAPPALTCVRLSMDAVRGVLFRRKVCGRPSSSGTQ